MPLTPASRACAVALLAAAACSGPPDAPEARDAQGGVFGASAEGARIDDLHPLFVSRHPAEVVGVSGEAPL
jgi:hypothetical protein